MVGAVGVGGVIFCYGQGIAIGIEHGVVVSTQPPSRVILAVRIQG